MRMIGSIPDKSAADRFGDYLVTLDIDHSIEQNGDSRFDVWIADDDEVERGKQELDRFLQSPDDPRYSVGRRAATLRSQESKQREKRRRNFIDVRTNWARLNLSGRYPLTIALIVISCLVALGTRLGDRLDPVGYWLTFDDVSAQSAVYDKIESGRVPTEEELRLLEREDYGWTSVRHGQLWRLVTPIFIHFGALHLIFNLFWLRDLGAIIETRRGTLRLAELVLATAVVSNVAQRLWSSPLFGEPAVIFGGMSGVVYGLFGYAWMKSRYQPHLQIHVGQNTVLIMLIWLVVCAVGIIGGVANAAHVAGLVVGVVAGFPFRQWRDLARRRGLWRR